MGYKKKTSKKWSKVFKWLTPIAFISAIAPTVIASNLDSTSLQIQDTRLNNQEQVTSYAAKSKIESVHISANNDSLVYQEGSWITLTSNISWKNNEVGDIETYSWWSYGEDKYTDAIFYEDQNAPTLTLKATRSMNNRTFLLNVLYGGAADEFVASSKEALKITVLPPPISELTYIIIFVSFSILIILCLILVDIRILFKRDN